MIVKARQKSEEHLMLESLHARNGLTEKDKQYYYGLEKGYQGELLFDSWMEELKVDCLILNDVRLKQRNNHFQNDSLMLLAGKLFLFEVKNFEGDYYYEAGRFLQKDKEERNNPLIQLEKNESLLRQLLHTHNIQAPVFAYVVFVNPAFTLYQAPMDKPIIYPSQIRRYLQQFNQLSTPVSMRERQLSEKLTALHNEKSPYSQVPDYEFGQLKKGMYCAGCRKFTLLERREKLFCPKCNWAESVESAVIRNVKEQQLLFPNRKIRTIETYEWCGKMIDKQRIYRILCKHLNKRYHGKMTYYEFENPEDI
ncbi:NERD domain-containing protein [Gracilibacillus oryzae]|uniref:NERD domain-containing protein n=1 Tax=Gracilibacillus oryzae TaxID=1672701 RepID=A0A7C8KX79_9BACI|nr:nuclease-related domain-containing protein [Gracilibacillus oryzae]KAB8127184.1 NERD domain-containing protein [Gracilibacillus oryzae]